MPTAFGRPGPRLRKLPGVLGAGASRNSRRVRFMAYVGFGGPTTPLVVYRSDMTSLRSGKQASCAAPQATEWPSRSADCRLKAPLCGPPASARFMGHTELRLMPRWWSEVEVARRQPTRPTQP